ncbi:MAG: neutral/alkaline non-lysosomal ceramidase N-terminal domain-containing protein [Candidatus Latescibacteria bacterium]|nr:neutral/alkaline non-lysosomal ceramidase N-terminal domain-containing protein [Candidatus Latescibacterota bacterium]
MTPTFQAGTARVDITPPLTIPYLGYEPRHALFHGVHDPLYARAVAVDDGTTQAVVIAADSIGFSNAILGPDRNFTREVRQRVHQRTGVPAEHVMLASSHAHSTPETIHLRRLLDTPAAGPWLEVLIDQLASAASMAVERRRPHTLKIGTGEVHGLSWSRRIVGKNGRLYQWLNRPPDDEIADWGTIDHRVGVLLLEAHDGGTCTVLSNFACHPVTVQVQPLVSADFPGAAMALVERALPGCENSLFLQAACGDQNPVRGDTRDFNDVQRYGLMLGGEVIKLAGAMRAPDYPASQPVVAVKSDVLSLAVRDLPAREPAQRAHEDAGRKRDAAATDEDRARFARERRMVEEALILIDRGTDPIPAEVQVMRLGDAALVALPGEPFCGLGLDIKARSAAPSTFVVGYANDWLGYLTTPVAWEQGGYEVSPGPWTRVGPAGGPQLVDKAVELIGALWR